MVGLKPKPIPRLRPWTYQSRNGITEWGRYGAEVGQDFENGVIHGDSKSASGWSPFQDSGSLGTRQVYRAVENSKGLVVLSAPGNESSSSTSTRPTM